MPITLEAVNTLGLAFRFAKALRQLMGNQSDTIR